MITKLPHEKQIEWQKKEIRQEYFEQRHNIKQVSSRESLEIIDKREPLGLFYRIEDGMYIGIDNSGGHAWTEDFETYDECMKWLIGEEE